MCTPSRRRAKALKKDALFHIQTPSASASPHPGGTGEGLPRFTALTQSSTKSTERQAAHEAETDTRSRADGDKHRPSPRSWAGEEAALRAQHHAAHRHSVPSRELLALLLGLVFGSRFLIIFILMALRASRPQVSCSPCAPRCISPDSPVTAATQEALIVSHVYKQPLQISLPSLSPEVMRIVINS